MELNSAVCTWSPHFFFFFWIWNVMTCGDKVNRNGRTGQSDGNKNTCRRRELDGQEDESDGTLPATWSGRTERANLTSSNLPRRRSERDQGRTMTNQHEEFTPVTDGDWISTMIEAWRVASLWCNLLSFEVAVFSQRKMLRCLGQRPATAQGRMKGMIAT